MPFSYFISRQLSVETYNAFFRALNVVSIKMGATLIFTDISKAGITLGYDKELDQESIAQTVAKDLSIN